MGNLVVCCKEGASKDTDPSEFARNNDKLIRKNKRIMRSRYVDNSPTKMMIVHHETESDEEDDTQDNTFDPRPSDLSEQKQEEQPDDKAVEISDAPQSEEKVEEDKVHDSNDDSKILKDLPEDSPYDVKPMIEPDMEQSDMPIARKRTHRRNNHIIKDPHDSKVNRMKTFYGMTGHRKDQPMSPIMTVTCEE